MSSFRILRSARALRAQPSATLPRRPHVRSPFQRRLQSTQSSSSSQQSQGFHPGAIGGIAGGGVAFLTCYLWYKFSGAQTVVKTAKQGQQYIDSTRKQLQEATPNPNEALKWLRQTAQTYAAFVPGASAWVNGSFDELDRVHDAHREEVDSIVSDCYNELKEISGKGLSVDTARQGWETLVKHLGRVKDLAGGTVSEVIDRHPELADKFEGNVDQLKKMGDRLGPEAKKIVDDAWKQIDDIGKSGASIMSSENIQRIKKVIQDATERVQRMGDEAWNKAMEQVKPYLEKNSQVKELIEKNASALKQGNVQEMYQKVKQAIESGDTGDLQQYVQNAAQNVQSSGGGSGGLMGYLSKVPGGDQVLSNLSMMQELAQKHGKEAEELLKSTVQEISDVLSKRAKEAKQLGEKAGSDASKK